MLVLEVNENHLASKGAKVKVVQVHPEPFEKYGGTNLLTSWIPESRMTGNGKTGRGQSTGCDILTPSAKISSIS